MTVFFVILVLLVIFVNGWTDAPSSIASCVTTRSMSPRAAVILAGICNFAGALVMALLNSSVAETVYTIVDFGERSDVAIRAMCAGMSAVVIWASLAFLLGIPTSESHALMSGITGAALASQMSLGAINFNYWIIVGVGLVISTLPAYFIARLIYGALLKLCAPLERRKAMKYFMRAQRFSAATSAFLHGAQDSQKFMGVLMLGLSLMSGRGAQREFEIPVYIVLLISLVMTLGTLCGGSKIIKKVGDEMVKLDASAGTASDAASSVVLAFCTLVGIPVSTTHSKTCAMMGAGSRTGSGVDRGVVRQMFLAWALTFPACASIGFLLGIIIT